MSAAMWCELLGGLLLTAARLLAEIEKRKEDKQ